jgi:SAM-dependent methyltransferase
MKIDPSVETVDHCVICKTSVTIPDARFAGLLGLVKPYDVRRCGRCGLRWLSPRPAPAGYRDLYTGENYFDGAHAVECYATISPLRATYFQQRLAAIEKHFPSRPLSILDVGAATGEFTHEARRRGHHGVGLELSDSARQTALQKYGLTLIATELAFLPGSARFDVIHMNHVFEHLTDPLATLQACRRLLRDKGLLVLEVPQQFDNDLDRIKRWLGPSGQSVFNAYSLHHAFFYTPQTLSQLLAQNGFGIARLVTANPARTPLRPFRLLNLALCILLWVSDKLHRGGNIIEVYAVRQ